MENRYGAHIKKSPAYLRHELQIVDYVDRKRGFVNEHNYLEWESLPEDQIIPNPKPFCYINMDENGVLQALSEALYEAGFEPPINEGARMAEAAKVQVLEKELEYYKDLNKQLIENYVTND